MPLIHQCQLYWLVNFGDNSCPLTELLLKMMPNPKENWLDNMGIAKLLKKAKREWPLWLGSPVICNAIQ